MSLKLALYRNEHELCCSDFCKGIPPHSNSENNLKNQLPDNLLRPQLSHSLLEHERDFKRIYSTTIERCCEQTASLTLTGVDSNWRKTSTKSQELYTKIILKIFPSAKNFKNDGLPTYIYQTYHEYNLANTR